MGKLHLIIVLILNLTIALQAQVKIEGMLYDALTLMPLPYANITLSQINAGTITNADGKFILKLPALFVSDTLQISFVGYQNYRLPINNNDTTFYNVYMQPQDVYISEIYINPVLAQDIIIKAFDAITQNYSTQAVRMSAFYSETVMQNKRNIQKIECVLSIYKGAYHDKKSKDRIKLEKGRVLINDQNATLFKYLYFINGPYENLYADIAKYPDYFIQIPQNTSNFLVPRNFNLYNYKVFEMSQEDEPKTVVI